MIIDPLKKFGKEEWENAGKPRVVVSPSTGLNHVDREFLKAQGVEVLGLLDNRRALSEIRASSEFTFMLLLLMLRGGPKIFNVKDRGKPGNELYNKPIGIIGHGRIGKNIAKWCIAFGAAPLVYDPYKGMKHYSLKQIFSQCAAVVVCCALTNKTKGMITGKLINKMPQNAVLINTSRGPVVDEKALVGALKTGEITGAGVDVYENEPEFELELAQLKNVVMVPHIASATVATRSRMAEMAANNLVSVLKGEIPPNCVNPEVIAKKNK